MADLLIKNAKIATIRGALSANVYVEDGKISSIKKTVSERADEVIDAKGDYLLPGVIDSHVHFRYPGTEYKEGWKTGSAAAAAG